MMGNRSLEDIKKSIAEFERRFSLPPSSWSRGVSTQELDAFINRCYPYLQIVAAGGGVAFDEVNVAIAKSSGWTIVDYGDAMGASAGEFVYGSVPLRLMAGAADDDDGDTTVNLGVGTLINQAFITASEMVEMALEREWYGVHIVDSHPIMARAAWITASNADLPVSGFEPSRHDERVKGLIAKPSSEMNLTIKGR